jgi:hypothetical protein
MHVIDYRSRTGTRDRRPKKLRLVDVEEIGLEVCRHLGYTGAARKTLASVPTFR